MPRDPALAGGAGLFVPIYPLWERASPLPSYANLAASTAKGGRLGSDVVSTLPPYAASLDEPFDPSPYSPVSRLHWNEVYLDDSVLPAAPEPTPGDRWTGRCWPGAAGRQLLDAAADLDPYLHAGIDLVRRRPS